MASSVVNPPAVLLVVTPVAASILSRLILTYI